MGYRVNIILDSISNAGCRLTTFEVTFPRIVLAEFNTHQMFSRNSASSRAIPISTMLHRVQTDPFVPTVWGKNQKGMQAAEGLDPEAEAKARIQWLLARDHAVTTVQRLQMPDIDLHKQTANRLLEPWLWHTVLVTATEYQNFFALRDNAMAMPEIQTPARMMRELYASHTPNPPYMGSDGFGWHLPLVTDEDKEELRGSHEGVQALVKLSCARCARVSYLTHDGKRDLDEDFRLYHRLRAAGHMSPFEHAAREPYCRPFPAFPERSMYGNFLGWVQHRKQLPHENVFQG